ncbi:hypothetical protein GQ54DRAFT_291251 [Martensiomyces pterosporus]|nr:hypothetical protein GQ54DRAFT_291251 [Martensiomyces pterosporus]
MSCNIFDVVLHPSVFDQSETAQCTASRTHSSAPPSIRSCSAPSSMSRASSSSSSSTKGPSPVSSEPESSAQSQWGDDEWSEIRKRLWNAKQPGPPNKPFPIWWRKASHALRLPVQLGEARCADAKEQPHTTAIMPTPHSSRASASRQKRADSGEQRQILKKQRSGTDDLPTLLDIFQFLDSPNPALYKDVCLDSEYSDIFDACLSADIYDGMRTSLYQYQKNSLFKMLKRELLPDFFLDPDFSPLRTAVSTDAEANGLLNRRRSCHPLLPYFQFSHGFTDAPNEWIYEHRPAGAQLTRAQDVSWYSDVRGGIICEDMGTGKTCECLALILLTKRQMARPPVEGEVLVGVGTVVSPLNTDITNDAIAPESHGKNSGGSQPGPQEHPSCGVPRLGFLAARSAILSCAESLRVMYDDGMMPSDIWNRLSLYPPYYWVNPVVASRSRRGSLYKDVQNITFKVYMSSSTLAVVPDNLVDQWVREKYKHIMDTNGLAMLKIDGSTQTIPEPCVLINYDIVLISVSRLSKEYIPIDSRIDELGRKCRCAALGYDGCVCGKQREDASYRSPLLRVHWKRLIVDEGHIMSNRNTTRSLMATYLIAERRWVCTGTPTHNLVHATSAASIESPSSSTDDASSLLSGDYTPNSDDAQTAASSKPRLARGYKMDSRERSSDFFQLGMLVSRFLRLSPFTQTTSSWTSIMVMPYKRNEPCARDRLKALMQNIMVRNRPETVSRDIQLPPLCEKLVPLPPTRHQTLTYNVIVAFFHINAVLTEREGRDYFFHAENKRHLRQIVENLFLSCFWFSVGLKHIKDGITNGQNALQQWEQGKKPYSDADVALLRDCISALERAAEDPSWAYAVQAASVGYWINGLPRKLERYIFQSPEANPRPQALLESSKADSVVSGISAAPCIQEMVARTKSSLVVASDDLPPLSTSLNPREFAQLASARVTGCTCSKVAYLVDQVMRYCHDEKCVIFVNNQGECIYVDEALKLARMPHLLYANHVTSQSQQRHNITTFATSVMYNVIVMDVHLAAYGIDLSAASRVWFVSPIWQAARERQAIKRAHRLGQKRVVHVETLVMEGSIEEALWRRRQELSNDDSEEIAKDVEEDGKMRSVLSNSSFIGRGSEEEGSRDTGAFSSELQVLPPNTKYPELLEQKYMRWSPDCPENAEKTVPFYKTKKLILRLPDVASSSDGGTKAAEQTPLRPAAASGAGYCNN